MRRHDSNLVRDPELLRGVWAADSSVSQSEREPMMRPTSGFMAGL